MLRVLPATVASSSKTIVCCVSISKGIRTCCSGPGDLQTCSGHDNLHSSLIGSARCPWNLRIDALYLKGRWGELESQELGYRPFKGQRVWWLFTNYSIAYEKGMPIGTIFSPSVAQCLVPWQDLSNTVSDSCEELS
jgi:hypothetical protein